MRGWAVALVLTLGLAGVARAQPPEVRIASGTLAGSSSETGVVAFKGIPFAAPPVGDLRWRPPQAPAAWTGVRDAFQFSPACPQHLAPADGPDPKWSEDCLYLNVWRPRAAVAASRLPVMVWIYGGGFTAGEASAPVNDGARLARQGVIVVSFNYRLGRLGWFAHPELTKEGGAKGSANYGLMDQIAALKWVKANIAAFGGDPANVTVFGESAGGMSVNLLMSTPAASGLFAKAITESGLGRIGARPLAEAEAQGTAFATSVQASNLAALRRLPVEALIPPGDANDDDPEAGPRPILDGVVVSEDVDTAFANGHEAKVPWIIGSNDYEAGLFPGMLADPDAKVMTLVPPAAMGMVLTAFDPDKTGDKRQIAANLITDNVFTEPARHLASLHAKNGAPVWRYFFAYVPEGERGHCPGADHGSEVAFVFGTLGKDGPPALKYTRADRSVSHTVDRYWTDFAKAGDPNAPDLPLWPQDQGDRVLVIDGAGPHAVASLRKMRLDLMAMTDGDRHGL